TWCAPCVEEMPSLERLHAALRDADFALLAVSQDEDGKRVVVPFVERMHLSFPVLLDPEHQVGDRYGVSGYPETFVIDRNGYVVEHVIGPRDWAAPGEIAQVRDGERADAYPLARQVGGHLRQHARAVLEERRELRLHPHRLTSPEPPVAGAGEVCKARRQIGLLRARQTARRSSRFSLGARARTMAPMRYSG